MNIKGRHLPKNLILIQEIKVSTKNRPTIALYPFETELPDGEENNIEIEIWICCNCGKEDSDNCDCKGYFEKKIIILKNYIYR